MDIKNYIVIYQNNEYLFVSDFAAITGLARSYIYLMLKKGKLKYIDKEGIKLITLESVEDYIKSKEKRINTKSQVLKDIQNLDDDKLKKLQEILKNL